MPRTSSKKAQETITASEGMSVIIDTPLLKTVSEAANFVGCAEIRLLELFSDALNLPEALGWETIPQEHEHLLNEFKAQASNTQVLSEAVEPATKSEEKSDLPPQPPIIQEEPEQPGAITEAPPSNKLADGVAQDLKDTQRIDQETLELQDLLFAAEADSKAQLVAAVKQHGWQVYSRLGSEIDAQTILQMAQDKLNNADAATNSRLGDLTQRLGMKSPDEIRQQIEKRKQDFFAQQQTRQQTWKTVTSSQTSKV